MFTPGVREAVIGLGANAQAALENLRAARSALRADPRLSIQACSPIYVSEALLPEHAPPEWNRPYLNAAVRVQHAFSDAETFVQFLKGLEEKLGRKKAPRWAPRAIDLDLLAWSGQDCSTPQATIPHPEFGNRPFAWLPAQDCFNLKDRPDWRYALPKDVPLRTQRSGLAWPELMGILNLSPDSFAGRHERPTFTSVEQEVRRLVSQGASVIDVGAESTRPGATPQSSPEEWARLEPFLEQIEELRRSLGFRLSLDSRHPKNVARALEVAHLDWINDVSGFDQPDMIRVALDSDARCVVMHSLSVPPRQEAHIPAGQDVISFLLAWANHRFSKLQEQGLPRERIVFDPGIGFGKTPAQNFEIIQRAQEFQRLGVPTLIGHSRKGFLDLDQQVPAPDRDLETAVLTAHLAKCAVDVIRVHDPASQARALRLGARLP